MELQFLDFDVSEDADGSVVFDALASVPAAQLARLHGEVKAVLGWAYQAFPGARAPLDDGGEWDFLLDGAIETRTPQALRYDSDTGEIASEAGTPGPGRFSISLAISGTAAFGEALREAFGIA